MRLRVAILISACLFSVTKAMAVSDTIDTDTAVVLSQPKSRNIVKRVIDYFGESNKPKEEKAFDISFIGGPHYTSDKGFGIGLVAAGQYRVDRCDSVPQPSIVSLYANITTKKYFQIGIEGLTIFSGDKYRLVYKGDFHSYDTYFWGIGYDFEVNNDNKSSYKYFMVEVNASFTKRMARNLYIGPILEYDYVRGSHFQKSRLWLGEHPTTSNFAVGLILQYDTRDFITNPYRGFCIEFDQRFYPKFLFNSQAFSSTHVLVSAYKQVWKGGVIAGIVEGDFTYGNTPWSLLPTFDSSDQMRGYYEGRYRDKCLLYTCVELRQKIYGRSGVTIWAGAGNVFPSFKQIDFSQTLPTLGIGYRWEFKYRMNIRLDFGWGKGTTGFVFSINEAF